MDISRMQRRLSRGLLVACVAVSCHPYLLAQDADPLVDKLVGTLKVNLAKSTYHPGPPPTEAAAATWTKLPNGFRQGRLLGYFDGEDYPDNARDGAYDHTAMSRVDEHSFVLVRKKAGQIVQMATRVISADGKTTTLTLGGV